MTVERDSFDVDGSDALQWRVPAERQTRTNGCVAHRCGEYTCCLLTLCFLFLEGKITHLGP